MSRFLFACYVLLICSCGLIQAATSAQPSTLNLHLRPDQGSPVAGILLTDASFEILQWEKSWVLVRQGKSQGWVQYSYLWGKLPQMDLEEPFAGQLPGSFEFRLSAVGDQPTDMGLIQGFLNLTVADSDRRRPISDPFYRDLVPVVSHQWGPLYYRHTQHYYVKGFFLWNFENDRIRVGLFKRRVYYKSLMGDLWSDDFWDSLLELEQGWRSSRWLFGKGREYYLELSFHF